VAAAHGDAPRRDARDREEPRHAHELLPELEGVAVVAVLAEALAVVGGDDDGGAGAPGLRAHPGDEALDLRSVKVTSPS
jgi:hypothetical protein